MPSEGFNRRLIEELGGHVTSELLAQSVRRARSHAGGSAYPSRVDDVSSAERIALNGLTAEVLDDASDNELQDLHKRTHQIYKLDSSRVPRAALFKAHVTIVEAMENVNIEHDASDGDERLHDRRTAIQKSSTVGKLVTSRVHKAFTVLCDDLHAMGAMNKEERIGLSSSVGDSLDILEEKMEELQLMDRDVPDDMLGRIMEVSKSISIAKSDLGQISQERAGYRGATTEQLDKNVACASCQFFYDRDRSCILVDGEIAPGAICDLWRRGSADSETISKNSAFALEDIDKIVEIEKGVPQLYNSAGGKHMVAKRIISLMPEHKTYVEPFAGGAAVLFMKDPSEVEVLNDKDPDTAGSYQSVKDIDENEISRLGRFNWIGNKSLFDKFKKEKNTGILSKASGALVSLYKYLYLRWMSFRSGDPTSGMSLNRDGQKIPIMQRIPGVKERLKNVQVFNREATEIIQKFDAPDTFHYIDPPYPDHTVYHGGGYTNEDLTKLLAVLSKIKGKFMLSLSSDQRKFIPEKFQIKRLAMNWMRGGNQDGKVGGHHREQVHEILVSNYDMVEKSQPGARDVHVNKLLDKKKVPAAFKSLGDEQKVKAKEILDALLRDGMDEGRAIATALTQIRKDAGDDEGEDLEKTEVDIVKSDESRHLVWVVVMVPHRVDVEGHWATPQVIETASHRWLLNGARIFVEHVSPRDDVQVVENYTLLQDLHVDDRVIKKGSWIIVLFVPNEQTWKAVQTQFKGGSVRGMAKVQPNDSPGEST